MHGHNTVHLRMTEQCERALELANWLEKHLAIERLIYLGLKSHPQHAVAKRRMDGYGDIISAEIKGGLKEAGQAHAGTLRVNHVDCVVAWRRKPDRTVGNHASRLGGGGQLQAVGKRKDLSAYLHKEVSGHGVQNLM